MAPVLRPLLLALLALPMLAPPAGAQATRRSPALADSVEDPATLIRLAESALASRRLGEAAELLERAEARLLTRGELASVAERPAVGGAIGEIAAARDAIARRDAAGAQTLAASALRRLEAGEPPAVVALPAPQGTSSATGTSAAPMPAGGGGEALVGGTASPPVPIGPDVGPPKPPQPPGFVVTPSVKAAPR